MDQNDEERVFSSPLRSDQVHSWVECGTRFWLFCYAVLNNLHKPETARHGHKSTTDYPIIKISPPASKSFQVLSIPFHNMTSWVFLLFTCLIKIINGNLFKYYIPESVNICVTMLLIKNAESLAFANWTRYYKGSFLMTIGLLSFVNQLQNKMSRWQTMSCNLPVERSYRTKYLKITCKYSNVNTLIKTVTFMHFTHDWIPIS